MLPRHRLSRDVFAALAAGGGGVDAMRELAAAEYSKHLTLLRGVLAAAQGDDEYHHARLGYDLLAAAWRKDRRAAETVIEYPAVGAWARRTIQACRAGLALPGAEPGRLRAVAAAAAIRARLPAEIEVAAIDGHVSLPSLGAVMVADSPVVVRSGGGRATVGHVEVPEHPYRDAPGWLGLRRVRVGSLDVVIDDLDPLRMPGARGLLPRQAASWDAASWDAALRRSWAVLERHHPVVAAEIAAAVSVIVPLSRPMEGIASTTSPDVFGAIGMSLPSDAVLGAETLTHELQHVKLDALLDLVTLTLPDNGQSYYAPWRDDPRPLRGLLQGAYAFLGVSGFWRRQRLLASGGQHADIVYARWRAAVALAIETLIGSGRLTSAGTEFVSSMAYTLADWLADPVTTEAEAAAQRAAQSHLARWRSVNGPNAV